MKRVVLTVLVLLFTYSQSVAQSTFVGAGVEAPDKIMTNLDSFLTYYGQYVKLSQDLSAVDADSKTITKGAFLKGLTTGDYLPLRLQTNNGQALYKLYRLNPTEYKGYSAIIKGYAAEDYAHYQMEGKTFPPFNFTDMNGKVYTNANTKGKILVLKGWFIACHNCVLEIPELNKLVKQYKNRKDVLFVSIATDAKAPLKTFLSKTEFAYAVVPHEDYFLNTLKINGYPTHIIINKEGRIDKVVSTANELAIALYKEK